MRLIDLTQSYFLFDAIENHKEKLILQRMDREILDLKRKDEEGAKESNFDFDIPEPV